MFTDCAEHRMIEDELAALAGEPPKVGLGEVIRYLLSSPGKRVRPLILILSSEAFGGDVAQSMNAALAVELVHAASLVHDDILDQGIERRGAPSTVERFGANAALLCGDYLISRSIELISWYSQPVINTFSRACMDMSEGEMLDLSRKSSADDYYLSVRKKTASLFAASAKLGCMIAGARDEDIIHFERYGIHLGMAYQIVDDLKEYLGLDHSKRSLRRSVTLPELYGEMYPKKTALLLCARAISDNSCFAKSALARAGGNQTMKERLALIVDQMTIGWMDECELLKNLC